MTDIEAGPEAGGAPQVVTVEIMGQRFTFHTVTDAEHVNRLAGYVEHKIQDATDHSTGGDAFRIAVLAAMNIADDYFRSRDTESSMALALKTRAGEIERMVDDALAEAAPRAET